MNKFFLTFAFLVLSLTMFAQQKKVAVYVTGEDVGINKVLGSKLVSAIARSEKYSAIERTESFLAELSKEQNYQRTGAVDDSELSRLGKQFGVQYICVAAVSEAFNEKYLSARLIDVESAQVERTASSSGAIQSLESLVTAANAVSTELLSSLGSGRQSNLKKVAVYVVKNEAGRNIGRVLGDKLVAGFTNSGRYIAIERTNSFLAQLNKGQNYQHSGAVDDSDLSRLGKQFGVQYVCVADVSDVFGEKFISARLIDVETAEVVNTHDIGGEMSSMSGCLRMANDIAANLSKGTFAEQAEEARLAKIRAEEEARIKAEAEQRKRPNGHECIDLGLSVRWATCNIGASSPEKNGHLYAWGEVTPKSKNESGWATYKYGSDYNKIYKYCVNDSYHVKYAWKGTGTPDDIRQLLPEDDAATQNWGGDWRIPTIKECEELMENCYWSWTTRNGVRGCEATSKINGEKIFFPTTNKQMIFPKSGAIDVLYINLWTSSIGKYYSSDAQEMQIMETYAQPELYNSSRCFLCYIRPVHPK